MKKLIFLGAIICSVIAFSGSKSGNSLKAQTDSVLSTDYCDGWKDGYCEGWKDVKGAMTMCPMTPMCPMAEFGKSTYRDGYNRGFKAGTKAAQK
jgi:hypothetical protein